MSALGQKRTCAVQNRMSALPPTTIAKADFLTRSCPHYPRKRTCAVQWVMSAVGRFCCRSQQRQLRDGWRELKELPAIRSLARMVFLHCHRTLHSLCKARLCDRRWSDDQLCEPAEVLRDCR